MDLSVASVADRACAYGMPGVCVPENDPLQVFDAVGEAVCAALCAAAARGVVVMNTPFGNSITTAEHAIAMMFALARQIPAADAMDPENCYIGFEIAYRSDADKATIEGAFEFVQNDAQIRILPPHSRVADYVELIQSMGDKELKLGEILVNCGTLTRHELDEALQAQESEESTSDEHHPIGEILVAQQVVNPGVVQAALQKQKQVKDSKASDAAMIRVNAEKLDEHINLIGELIIASAGASLIAQRTAIPELLEATARLSKLVEEVRDSALNLRMVQIGATFNRFQRVVRDVSEIGRAHV